LARFARALGTTVGGLLREEQPDDLGLIREQIRRVVGSVIESKDRQTLCDLGWVPVRLSETALILDLDKSYSPLRQW
jgi:hypothetical protein